MAVQPRNVGLFCAHKLLILRSAVFGFSALRSQGTITVGYRAFQARRYNSAALPIVIVTSSAKDDSTLGSSFRISRRRSGDLRKVLIPGFGRFSVYVCIVR